MFYNFSVSPSNQFFDKFIEKINKYHSIIKDGYIDQDTIDKIQNFLNKEENRNLLPLNKDDVIFSKLWNLAEKLYSIYEKEEMENNCKILADEIKSLATTMYIPNEIKDAILSHVDPIDLTQTDKLDKQFKELSNERRIYLLNHKHVSINKLGLNEEQIHLFLQKYGERVKYLNIRMFYSPKETALKFIDYCPNLNHLKINGIDLGEWGASALESHDLCQFLRLT